MDLTIKQNEEPAEAVKVPAEKKGGGMLIIVLLLIVMSLIAIIYLIVKPPKGRHKRQMIDEIKSVNDSGLGEPPKPE